MLTVCNLWNKNSIINLIFENKHDNYMVFLLCNALVSDCQILVFHVSFLVHIKIFEKINTKQLKINRNLFIFISTLLYIVTFCNIYYPNYQGIFKLNNPGKRNLDLWYLWSLIFNFILLKVLSIIFKKTDYLNLSIILLKHYYRVIKYWYLIKIHSFTQKYRNS